LKREALPVPPELQQLLRETSRSFYLTVRVLPGSVRSQIGLAYLLARATDTIADTGWVPVETRLTALGALRARILGQSPEPVDFSAVLVESPTSGGASLDAERRLLLRVEEAVRLMELCEAADVEQIRSVLDVITGGQELDLQRFEVGGAGELRSLATLDELEDYTYRVAGCVGEFWTHLTRRRVFPKAKLNDAEFLADGIRFGKGLQYVNILRDLPRDLAAGRCYVPEELLKIHRLSPDALKNPATEARFRPLYNSLLERATHHLQAGWRYTSRIPGGQLRLRLACAWPVLLGARTVAKLRREAVLDPSRRIKVSRADVREVLLGSVLRLPVRGAWERQFDQQFR
jgi:farnesyl-diphosphate farnesyltransferase